MTSLQTSLNDGRLAVWAVASIDDISAPTTSELNAGVSLQCVIDADGGIIGFSPQVARVDTAALCSVFDTTAAGRLSFNDPGLRFYKQVPDTDDQGSDPVFELLGTTGYTGNIVMRRDLPEDAAWATGQQVEVYPVTTFIRQEGDTPKNSVHKYTIPLSMNAPPNLNAVVA